LVLLLPLALARRQGVKWRELLFLLIPAAVYLAAAMKSDFNIGVRHILPIYPFLIVLAAFSASTLARSRRAWLYAISAILIFSVVSSVRAFPSYLPYSNELWGGPSHTYKYLTDSNVDWGQQLKQTRKYLDDHGTKDCWFSYFAREVADPGYYGISCKALQEPLGLPSPTPAHISGTVLISATELSPALWGPGELNPYLQFTKLKPDDSIADGIFVFRGEFDVPLAAAQSLAETAYMRLRDPKPSEAQLSQALTEAQASVSLSPNICAGCQEVLGDVLMKLNRKDEAKAAYQRALNLAQAMYPEFQDDEIASVKRKLQ
jgi:tetratricopeptide (TPR) repeat protein